MSILRLCDKLAINLLLVILGLALGELVFRLAGFHPWVINSQNEIRERYAIPDTKLGWRLAPRESGSMWSGAEYHSETILQNGTRLVLPPSSQAASDSILVLGDSSIFGWGLNDHETFASRLATRLPHFGVINAAVPGYGILQSYLWMSKHLQEFRPRYVILGYADYLMARDTGALEWARAVAEHSIRANYFGPYAKLGDSGLELVPAGKYFFELPGRNFLTMSRALEEIVAGIPARVRYSQRVEISKELFRLWADAVVSYGAEPLVLFWNNDQSRELFLQFLKSRKIGVLDCVPDDPSDPGLLLENDNHPSAKAVDNWAKCVQRIILNRAVESSRNA